MNGAFHPRTQSDLERFIAQPRHALAIFGPSGYGKRYVAEMIALRILSQQNIENNPQLYVVAPSDTNSIGIDEVRHIQAYFKLRSADSGSVNRIVIIENAHSMTTEAQNALLKILEEPPSGGLIILTAKNRSSLLSTIQSRVSTLDLQAPTEEDVIKFFGSGFNPQDVKKAWLMSGERVGLTHALLGNKEHAMIDSIELAKQIIGMDAYQRMLQVDSLQKQDLEQLLEALDIISTAAFYKTMTQTTGKRWHSVRKQIQLATEDAQYNTNNRLLVADLLLSL